MRIREVQSGDVFEVKKWLADTSFRGEFLAFGRDSDNIVVEKLSNIAHSAKNHKFLAIERISDSKLIGLLLYQRAPYFDYSEVGFYVVPAERRKGLGSEGMRLLIEHIFRNFSVDRIEAGTSSLNIVAEGSREVRFQKGRS